MNQSLPAGSRYPSRDWGHLPDRGHNVNVINLKEVATSIDDAATTLRGVTRITPLQVDDRLSTMSGATVYLKREDLQPVRSYKLRGAYTLMSQLSDQEREAGIVCASAGNHGQGVAWSCARLGIKGSIYVPATTPRQKRERMRALGGDWIDLVVVGNTYDDASLASKACAKESGATLVPAFDDLRTIAGQGTVIREATEQLGRAPDVCLVPVGGGGLLAGTLAWLQTNSPSTRVVALEPAGANCLQAALLAGHPIDLSDIDTFVDGAAVSRAGDVTLDIIQQSVPEFVSIPEGQVCSEMLDMYQVDGIIAEPAGALAAACLRTGVMDETVSVNPSDTVVAILSGGNNDVSRYSEVVERSLVHEGRKRYFLVNFPQEPGALRRFLEEILGPNDDVTLFEYVKRSNRELGPALVGIELGNPSDYPALLERLRQSPLHSEVVEPGSAIYRYLV